LTLAQLAKNTIKRLKRITFFIIKIKFEYNISSF
jgi:hypothetical protein